jgi:glycosyltransferase involved in cell wall biosynthesis
MRVMFAITKGEVGGAQEHLRILAQGLLQRGHEVALAVTPGTELADSAESMGCDIFPWKSISGTAAPLSNLSARRELGVWVDQWKPEVLHLHSSVAGAVATGLLRPPKGATIFTCHHVPFGSGRRWSHRLLARPAAQFSYPRMDGIILVGTRDLPIVGKIAKNVPVVVVRNAVPTFGPPISSGSLRPSAVWIARLAHPKDPLLAVEAWEKVVARVPEAFLVICGTGTLERALKERIARSSAKDNISAVGFAEDVSPLIRQASIFLLISRIEGGTTMATLEAMGQGLVPVVMDVGDAKLLAERDCGVVVGSYDSGSIAEALVGLMSEPARFASLRANALAFSRGRTVDDFTEETVEFYLRVLRQSHVQI